MRAAESFRREAQAFALEVVAPEQSPRAWIIELCVAAIVGLALVIAL